MARNVHIFARELCPLLGHPGIWHLKGSTLPKVDQSGRWYLETPPLSEATKDVVRLFNEMHSPSVLNYAKSLQRKLTWDGGLDVFWIEADCRPDEHLTLVLIVLPRLESQAEERTQQEGTTGNPLSRSANFLQISSLLEPSEPKIISAETLGKQPIACFYKSTTDKDPLTERILQTGDLIELYPGARMHMIQGGALVIAIRYGTERQCDQKPEGVEDGNRNPTSLSE